MSRDHILEYILNRLSPTELMEKLEPFITMEELAEVLADKIDIHFHQAFEEELEEYYADV